MNPLGESVLLSCCSGELVMFLLLFRRPNTCTHLVAMVPFPTVGISEGTECIA